MSLPIDWGARCFFKFRSELELNALVEPINIYIYGLEHSRYLKLANVLRVQVGKPGIDELELGSVFQITYVFVKPDLQFSEKLFEMRYGYTVNG